MAIRIRATLTALLLLAAVAACGSTAPPLQGPIVMLSALNGSTQPTTFTLTDDTAGVTRAKFYLTTSGVVYLSTDETAPFQAKITVPAGKASVQVRHTIGGVESRVNAAFTASTSPSTVSTSSASSTSSTSSSASSTTMSTASSTSGGSANVATVAELEKALTIPGNKITLADGVYRRNGGDRWHLPADDVTLTGSRAAILESDSPTGDYGLWVTGDRATITGITIRNATKGIVLDGSVGSVLTSVEVHTIGDEGVHFRACSADGILQDSYVHDTGVQSPNFGEGVYVGSANSNWSRYQCTDGRDNSENVTIRNNVFERIAAEGADLKEGTESGTLTGNTFIETGFGGQNSADSAIDAKGNGWVIEGNTIRSPRGANLDAIQTHSVYSGYGTGNTIRNNRVEGAWPGFGIGLYPQAGNVVTCDNTAPNAAKGLVGASGRAISCQ